MLAAALAVAAVLAILAVRCLSGVPGAGDGLAAGRVALVVIPLLVTGIVAAAWWLAAVRAAVARSLRLESAAPDAALGAVVATAGVVLAVQAVPVLALPERLAGAVAPRLGFHGAADRRGQPVRLPPTGRDRRLGGCRRGRVVAGAPPPPARSLRPPTWECG